MERVTADGRTRAHFRRTLAGWTLVPSRCQCSVGCCPHGRADEAATGVRHRPRRPRPGPRPGHDYRELVGGPLDGLLLDVTGWGEAELRDGVGLVTEIGAYGPGGRAEYGPRSPDSHQWDWRGDVR